MIKDHIQITVSVYGRSSKNFNNENPKNSQKMKINNFLTHNAKYNKQLGRVKESKILSNLYLRKVELSPLIAYKTPISVLISWLVTSTPIKAVLTFYTGKYCRSVSVD